MKKIIQDWVEFFWGGFALYGIFHFVEVLKSL